MVVPFLLYTPFRRRAWCVSGGAPVQWGGQPGVLLGVRGHRLGVTAFHPASPLRSPGVSKLQPQATSGPMPHFFRPAEPQLLIDSSCQFSKDARLHCA